MIVTNITARWTRRLPREQYGHAEAELSAQAVLTEGESLEEVANQLLGDLRSGVSAKLGLGTSKMDLTVSQEHAGNPPASPTVAPENSAKTVESKAARSERASPAPAAKETKTSEPAAATAQGEQADTSAQGQVEPSDFTPLDLHNWMLKLIHEKKITGQKCREIVESKGVARTKELSDDQVIEVKNEIEALLNA